MLSFAHRNYDVTVEQVDSSSQELAWHSNSINELIRLTKDGQWHVTNKLSLI